MEVVYSKKGKLCFSVVMYGFCSSNALYLASLSFTFRHLEGLVLFQIISQPSVAYKSVVYKRAFNAVSKSSKNKKIILPHEFIFVFIWYFIGVILLEKSCQKWKVWKKYKNGDGGKGGVVYRRRVQTFCTLWY